jgi:hypothetical protein
MLLLQRGVDAVMVSLQREPSSACEAKGSDANTYTPVSAIPFSEAKGARVAKEPQAREEEKEAKGSMRSGNELDAKDSLPQDDTA